MAASYGSLEWPDYVVLVLYFVLILSVGALSAMKGKRDSVGGFFLARRSMHWIPVGASMFASNIGSEHFVGLAGSGASSGITVAGFELNAMFVLLVLGWIFLPVYMVSGVYTVPEYLKRRFDSNRIEILLSVLGLLNYIFTKISADLYAGSLFIQACFQISTYPAIVALLLLSAIFTIAGGQHAVIWVDLIQTCLMIAGALTVTFMGFIKVGGYDVLMHEFYYKQPNRSMVLFDDNNVSCSQVSKGYSHLLLPVTDTNLPWTGAIFGITVSALWYWCSDQLIVQRGLSAKNISHGKAGTILAGYCKFLPLWLCVMPGMISRVLYTDVVACSDPGACEKACGSRSGCTNHAYPLLVVNMLPLGLRGMMLSVMLATLMCSLSAVFNGSSTIFTINIWRKIRSKASQVELLIIGRVFVIFMLAVAVAWIPIMSGNQNSRLFDYLQSVTSCLGAPVCAVFTVAMLSTRVTEQGVFWGLLLGIAVGLTRFGMEFSYPPPMCGSHEPDTRPMILSAVHYLHFGIILFSLVVIVIIAISLLTKPMDKERLVRLTFWTRHSKELRVMEKPSNKSMNGHRQPSIEDDNSISEFPTPIDTIPLEEIRPGHRIPIPLGSRPPRRNKCCRILQMILGLPTSPESESKPEHIQTPEEDLEEALAVAAETPFWKCVTDFNGVLLLASGLFIWGYFA